MIDGKTNKSDNENESLNENSTASDEHNTTRAAPQEEHKRVCFDTADVSPLNKLTLNDYASAVIRSTEIGTDDYTAEMMAKQEYELLCFSVANSSQLFDSATHVNEMILWHSPEQ
jgi:hypothetical protein